MWRSLMASNWPCWSSVTVHPLLVHDAGSASWSGNTSPALRRNRSPSREDELPHCARHCKCRMKQTIELLIETTRERRVGMLSQVPVFKHPAKVPAEDRSSGLVRLSFSLAQCLKHGHINQPGLLE